MINGLNAKRVAASGAILFLVLYGLLAVLLYQDVDPFEGEGSCVAEQRPFRFTDDLAWVRVESEGVGKVKVSGFVNVSQATYQRFNLKTHPLKLRLEVLQSSPFAMLPLQENLELGAWTLNFTGENRNTFADIQPKSLELPGNPQAFPFDQYRYGYRLVPYIEVGDEATTLDFSSVSTHVSLSTPYVPRVVKNSADYIEPWTDITGEDQGQDYVAGECAVRIERSGVFKFMVGLMTVFLFFPAVYSLFRTDMQPAIDVLATVASVAAIRMFLIGPVENFQFYWIDLVFGAAVALSATLPLIRGAWARPAIA